MQVLWLGDPACADRALVGGKAANLSRLSASYPVPPGFCLTAAAFGCSRASVLSQVATAYAALSQRCASSALSVAVRSSAIDEDSADSSFAGQHDTYLNVVGPEAIVQAIVRCWDSARSGHAVAYRRKRGLTAGQIRLAVLIQQLIAADVGVVAFSTDPAATLVTDEIIIEASWGLGPSIVGGAVTPDRYVLRRADLAVIGRHIADKRRMTVSVPSGTEEVDVPRLLRQRPTLDDAKIQSVARLTIDLERTMGWPVDVEAAFQGDRLHLLQCRAVTALGSRR